MHHFGFSSNPAELFVGVLEEKILVAVVLDAIVSQKKKKKKVSTLL